MSPGSGLATACPARTDANEMAPVEWPVSDKVIGRMRRWMKRPGPGWRPTSSRGTAEPVRMNWPTAWRSSTA